MKVTRNVITDLWPVYDTGEASADTRALVDEFLSGDPEFAQLIRQSVQESLPGTVPVSLSPEHQMTTLDDTKKRLRRRSTWMALAILFTCLPFSFAFDRAGFRWLVWSAAPNTAVILLVAALGAWVGYALSVRETRSSGL